MTTVDDVARTLNTVGLATWFGGSFMGAFAVRGSDGSGVQRRGDTSRSLQVENDVWTKWRPVQTAAIAAYLAGAAKLTTTNKGRVLGQRGVPKVAAVKGACTLGALGATWYATRLGSRIHHDGDVSDDDTSAGGDIPDRSSHDEPRDATGRSREAQDALRRLRVAQLAVPVLTGIALVADSRLGEQQRPGEVLRGMASRIVPETLHSLPDRLHVGDAADALRRSDAVHSLEDVAKQLPEAARSLVAR